MKRNNSRSRIRFILAMVLSMLVSSAVAKKQKEALIAFDSLTINVGTVYMDDPIQTYKIPYVNKGKAALVISKVETSCECTQVDFTQSPLKKGKADTLTVHLDMSPYTVRGNFLKELTVHSNSSGGTVEIIIKGFLNYKRKNE
ncbi:MAG: DUF1573 domain-containing protein [Prevotella sp.]|nr:DUF1573 domain-containing protein [Prevotella sp.]